MCSSVCIIKKGIKSSCFELISHMLHGALTIQFWPQGKSLTQLPYFMLALTHRRVVPCNVQLSWPYQIQRTVPGSLHWRGLCLKKNTKQNRR